MSIEIENDIQEFNLLNSCRLCLTNNIDMDDLFNDACNKIIHEIEFCTGIQLKHQRELPARICNNCLKKLSKAHEFKTMCLLTEQALQRILLKRIKKEIADNAISLNYSDSLYDEGIDNCDLIEIKVENKTEQVEHKLTDIRRSKRDKRKVDKEREPKTTKVKKPGKERTPRYKKYKFTKLFCESCNIKFTSKIESDKHKKDVHRENVSWVCEICGTSFAHRGSHHNHVKSHHAPRYACAHCDYSSAIKSDLEKHLRIHLGVKRYACAECAARYHTSSNLHQHVRLQHRRVPKRFACELCARRFHDRYKLNRHRDSHADVKRFVCELCQSCFSRRCQWKKHLEKQHSVIVPAQRPGRQPANLKHNKLL